MHKRCFKTELDFSASKGDFHWRTMLASAVDDAKYLSLSLLSLSLPSLPLSFLFSLSFPLSSCLLFFLFFFL
jgi:hypothetical protein